MKADIKGALAAIDTSWSSFEHKGHRMSRKQVKAVLEYGLSKGYKHTGELPDKEVDDVLENLIKTN